ncbi:hypothetical protein Afil01_07140 [Actinorhabdospora filicis]|uniref:Diadenosine tetraphosphate (Ap4A) hydrolase n=1 Tax=Actinorhabdospora filicis TaxID=1785913 RepID=A0A9W6W1H6_9ACTN|nr:hypothetical protein [Actinorhabdospora filicis]GLZ75907.1 hypothetical protein Afil01_07140 [Actinorhabdospora filicis]
MTTPAKTPGKYAAHLTYGVPSAAPEGGIPFWEIFPYEGELSIKAIEDPVIPEPPRGGEGGRECGECARGDDDGYVWTDANWRLSARREPEALVTLLLTPRGHYDSGDLPAGLSAELGPVMQRVENAMMGLGDIARVHMSKWGDGGSHLHWWFFARPEGLMQFRGTCLALWGDVLPPLPRELWEESLASIASQMTATGGETAGQVV